jgi:tetratricopeptide (TPR) repeat protein
MTLGLEKLSEKYNTYLDPAALLKELDIRVDMDPDKPNILIATCPLHKEKDQPSLQIRQDNRTFFCSVPDCPGHKGGNLIQLYSLARDISVDDACLQIFNIFGLKTSDETRLLKRNLYITFSEKLIAEDYLQAAQNMLLAGFNEFPDNLVIISRLINIFTREGDKPNICDFLIKASRIVARNRNYSSAKAALKRVFSFDPKNKEALDLLGEITVAEIVDFYESALTPEGEEPLFESLNEISITPFLRVQLTEVLLKHKRYKMIERLYSDLPDDLDDDQRSHLQEVIDKLRVNIPQYENPVDYLLFLADILLKMGDFESAKDRLLEANKAVEDGYPTQRMEEVEIRLKNFENLLIKKEYENARVFLQTGNYSDALHTLNKTISTGHPSPELLNTIIHCHFKLDQLNDAHEKCLQLSEFHESNGEFCEAALSLYHALLFKPAHHETIVKLIGIFKQLGHNDIAEQVAELAERQVVLETKQIFKEKVGVATPPQTPPPREIIPDIESTPKPVIPDEPKASENEFDIQLPLILKLYTTGTSTDRMAPIAATTLSLADSHLTANCGDIRIPGIQPASVNYILQNCQVMGSLSVPDHKEPVKIFGRISKVQNRRVSNVFHKIVTIDILESEESGIIIYNKFLKRLTKGELPPSPEPVKSDAPVEKPVKSKVQKELLVSIRFLDEAGEEKCPDYYYANTMNLGRNNIILNFGELSIPGVPTPSQNFFLENCVYELTIPLPEHNHTVRLLGQAKKVKSKIISGKKNKIVEVEFSECAERDRQVFQDYIQCFLSV